MNQITIFDLIEKPKAAPVFPGSDFSEVVEYINKRLNVNFQKVDESPEGDNEYYEYKPNKHIKLELSKSRFDPEIYEGREFIGVGFETTKDGISGASAPLDSVEEAIQWFEDIVDNFPQLLTTNN